MTGPSTHVATLALVLGPVERAFDVFLGLFGDASCAVGRATVGGVFCEGYMQLALLAGIGVGVVAPLVGTFLVHRRMALVGDTLAHAAFAGVALGLFLGSSFEVAVSPQVSALGVAVVAALGIQTLVDRTDTAGDVAMAIVLSGAFALGTVLMSLGTGGLSVSIHQYLFGSLVLVDRASVGLLTLLVAVVVGTVALTYRSLVFVTFDETAARVAGVPVRRYERLLAVLTALVVVAAMQILGVILVAAMLVVPVAAATQVAGSFRASLWLSVVAAELAVVAGLVVSYYAGTQGSGTVVLLAIGVFCLAAGVSRLPSGVTQRVRSRLGQRDDTRTR
jgi:zinc transport system permease protein